jgi:hypothetical protein
MAKVLIAELDGQALDWAVAKCEGYDCLLDNDASGPWLVPQEGYLHDEKPLGNMRYSNNWSQGGPIIERERITIDSQGKDYLRWRATTWAGNGWVFGDAPLTAAMRCYVASKHKEDFIEVPDELLDAPVAIERPRGG